MKRPVVAPEDRVLTTGEAADMVRVQSRTIVHWCDDGKLKYFRTPGGHRRIRLGDLAAVVKGLRPE